MKKPTFNYREFTCSAIEVGWEAVNEEGDFLTSPPHSEKAQGIKEEIDAFWAGKNAKTQKQKI